jgi:hypothetical protein
MTISLDNKDAEILAVKDDETERPIPTVWRSVIRDIIKAFVKHDYILDTGVYSVAPVSTQTAEQIKEYIQCYGEELIELPEETWNSSACIWMGTQWDVLIDLWTLSEGRSDLVLEINVSEADDSFNFHIYMVYVP